MLDNNAITRIVRECSRRDRTGSFIRAQYGKLDTVVLLIGDYNGEELSFKEIDLGHVKLYDLKSASTKVALGYLAQMSSSPTVGPTYVLATRGEFSSDIQGDDISLDTYLKLQGMHVLTYSNTAVMLVSTLESSEEEQEFHEFLRQ